MLVRCESSHAFLKKYLSSKKTQQSLYTTWCKMEATQRDQLMQIRVSTDVERSSTPLTIDRKLFQLVFEVVT
jgi:hypothetical protein